MLVVICGIRKLLECVFTKRELRVLDDLLPESGMKRRGAFKKKQEQKSRNHRNSEMYDRDDYYPVQERLMLQYDGSKKKHRKDAELDIELEALYRHDSRKPIVRPRTPSIPKTKEYQAAMKSLKHKHGKRLTTQRRLRAESFSSVSSSKIKRSHHKRKSSNPQVDEPRKPKCSIYVKRSSDVVFTPLHMQAKTVSEFLNLLKTKFGEEFEESKVASIFQQNKHNFVFHLDDEMLDCIQSHEVFEIKVENNPDDEEKINITLIELESK